MPKKKNLTLSIDKALIDAAKVQADRLGVSLNEMIREFLDKASRVPTDKQAQVALLEALDQAARTAKKVNWKREDAYNE